MLKDLPNNVSSTRIYLNELKSKIAMTIRDGGDFEEVRKMYTEINELQCHLTTLQWTPITDRYSGTTREQSRQRHADDMTDENARGN